MQTIEADTVGDVYETLNIMCENETKVTVVLNGIPNPGNNIYLADGDNLVISPNVKMG
jgi:hypothetical protein